MSSSSSCSSSSTTQEEDRLGGLVDRRYQLWKAVLNPVLRHHQENHEVSTQECPGSAPQRSLQQFHQRSPAVATEVDNLRLDLKSGHHHISRSGHVTLVETGHHDDEAFSPRPWYELCTIHDFLLVVGH